MIGGRTAAKRRRHGTRARGRRPERAKAVENARRRQHFAIGARIWCAGIAWRYHAGEGDDSLEHLDEGAR